MYYPLGEHPQTELGTPTHSCFTSILHLNELPTNRIDSHLLFLTIDHSSSSIVSFKNDHIQVHSTHTFLFDLDTSLRFFTQWIASFTRNNKPSPQSIRSRSHSAQNRFYFYSQTRRSLHWIMQRVSFSIHIHIHINEYPRALSTHATSAKTVE